MHFHPEFCWLSIKMWQQHVRKQRNSGVHARWMLLPQWHQGSRYETLRKFGNIVNVGEPFFKIRPGFSVARFSAIKRHPWGMNEWSLKNGRCYSPYNAECFNFSSVSWLQDPLVENWKSLMNSWGWLAEDSASHCQHYNEDICTPDHPSSHSPAWYRFIHQGNSSIVEGCNKLSICFLLRTREN
jgi:hypothetical protein